MGSHKDVMTMLLCGYRFLAGNKANVLPRRCCVRNGRWEGSLTECCRSACGNTAPNLEQQPFTAQAARERPHSVHVHDA